MSQRLIIRIFILTDIGLSDSKPSTQIDFDALALVRTTMGANQLHEIVLRAIERNLDIVLDSVTNVDRSMKTFVFQPKEIGHFISFVYPASSADDGNTDWVKVFSSVN